MRLFRLGLALPLFAFASPVFAQEQTNIPDTKGFYATLGLGASWPQNVTATDSTIDRLVGVPVKGSFSTGGGFAGDVGVGYDFGSVRTELTYLYTNATLNSLTLTANGGSANIGTTASINSNSVLASAYYDIPTKSRWSPYFGGGLGYTNLSTGTITGTALGITATLPGSNQGLFGYQAKVGVSYLASSSTDIYVEGTYQGATGFTVDTTTYGSLNTWGAKVGFRYRFSQPKASGTN